MSFLSNKILMAFAFIFCLGVLSSHAFDPPPIFSDITESGIEICIANIPQAKDVAIRVYVRGGAVAENEFRGYGLAKSVQEIILLSLKNESEKNWLGSFGGNTDFDSICFYAKCPKSSFPASLEIVASVLAKPAFSDSLWQITREKLGYRLAHQSKIKSLFQQTAFAHTPLRYSVDGKLSLFLKLKKEDLINFYNKYFVAENIVVVIVGDINASAAKKQVADAFSTLSRKSAAFKPEFKFPPQLAPRWFEHHADVSQSLVCVGVKTFDKMNKAAFDVFARLIDKNSIASVLNKQNRSIKNLDIQARFLTRDRGVFDVSFDCEPVTAAGSARSIGDWLIQLNDQTWDKNKIKLVSKKMLIGLMKKIIKPECVAELVGDSIIKFNNPNSYFNVANQWQEVNQKQIKKLCSELFQPDKLNTVLVSPDELRKSDSYAEKSASLINNERNLLGSVNYPVQYIGLPNNVLLALHKNPSIPFVRFDFSTIGGLWCESPLNNGIFALIGEFLTKCSDDFSPNKFDKISENIGCRPDYIVGEQTFSLTGECLPQDAFQAAELLCSAWSEPDFDEDFLREVKKSARNKIESQSTNIADFADYTFRVSMFEKLPYRLNKKGAQDFILNVSIEQIKTAYYDFITPQNTVITVSGNFDEKEMEEFIRKKLKGFQAKGKSENFANNVYTFILNPVSPRLTVLLQPENMLTSAVSRFYYSDNQESMVVCGIRAPGFNVTNFPDKIVSVFNAGLLIALEKLKSAWKDISHSEIISSFDTSVFRGYNAGWIYAYITVPQKYSIEAKNKLQNVFISVLNMLADGKNLKQAIARAKYQDDLSADLQKKNMVLSRNILFNIKSSKDFDKIDKTDFQNFREMYGNFPLTVVVLPAK